MFDDPETPCIEGCRAPSRAVVVREQVVTSSHVGTASLSRAPDAGLVSEWRAGAVEAAARPVLH